MKRIEAVNDFVIKFANVNGSGSASANELFAKAVMRMGVPVSPRNIFPSNIQGLPTWYEARVSEQGWLGRRGGIDMMVAMNPQTWAQDVAEIEPGGYLFYDSTRPLPPSAFRDDMSPSRHAAHRDLQRHLRRPAPAPAVQEHHLRGRAGGAAGHRDRGHRGAVRRAVQRQGAAAGVERARAAPGPRLRAEHLQHAKLGLRVRAAPTRWATTSSSTATAPPRWAASTAAPRSAPGTRSRRRRRWPRPSRSTATSYRVDPATGEHRYAIVQAEDETRLDRHGRRAPAGTARAPSPPPRARASA